MNRVGSTHAAEDVRREVERLIRRSLESPSTDPWAAVSVEEVRLTQPSGAAAVVEIVFTSGERPGCRFGYRESAVDPDSAAAPPAEAWASEIVAGLQEAVEAEGASLPPCEPGERIHWIA